MNILTLMKQTISRKTWVSENVWNFHTVIRLPFCFHPLVRPFLQHPIFFRNVENYGDTLLLVYCHLPQKLMETSMWPAQTLWWYDCCVLWAFGLWKSETWENSLSEQLLLQSFWLKYGPFYLTKLEFSTLIEKPPADKEIENFISKYEKNKYPREYLNSWRKEKHPPVRSIDW